MNKKYQELLDRLVSNWKDSYLLTPKQAYCFAGTLNYWHDAEISIWEDDPSYRPLCTLEPFRELIAPVKMLIGENYAFADKAMERCREVAKEIENGIMPFHRHGCFFDEVLMAMALPYAKIWMEKGMEQDEEWFSYLPAVAIPDDEGGMLVADDQWDGLWAKFDDESMWNDWQLPVMGENWQSSEWAMNHHPFTWFDLQTLKLETFLR